MRNYFTFGQFDSRDFGVYISGEGTYNAPARVYDAISVPGRNGDLLIDRGKFENISVKYPAFIAGDNFRSNLAAFRSAMLSGSGYARLTDTYHPDEYRLAYYGDPIEMSARKQNDGSEFDIVFNCKPQRFLTSGETPVTYPPGGESGKNVLPYPYAYGDTTNYGITYTNNEDGTITANGTATGTSTYFIRVSSVLSLDNAQEYILTGCPAGGDVNYGYSLYVRTTNSVGYYDTGDGKKFKNYTASSVENVAIQIQRGVTVNNLVFRPMIRKATDPPGWEPYYDGATQIYNPTLFSSNPLIRVTGAGTVSIGSDVITVGSGYSYVDIDSEIQNCYCGTQNANAVVSFASGEFPKLEPGLSGVSYSSGISSVQITPRWWRI